MRIKNTISGILVFMILLAYSYETVQYFIKFMDSESIVCIDDNECEEKSKESEETNKKNEILNLSEHLFPDSNFISDSKELATLGSNQNPDFSSSNYSLEIFSPPELI